MTSIYNQLAAIAKKSEQKAVEVVQASIMRLFQRVVVESPVDTGIFRNNWFTAIDNIDTSNDRPANTSGAQSIGQIDARLNDVNLGQYIYFTNSMPYANRIEYGWSAQAPNGVVRVNALEWQDIVKSEVAKVGK